MGLDEDLDQAMKPSAAGDDRADLRAEPPVAPSQAYQTCSLAVDFRVTQTVNGEKGVHGMLPKGLLF